MIREGFTLPKTLPTLETPFLAGTFGAIIIKARPCYCE